MKSDRPYKKKRIYFENLDGIRFFCFLLVFLFHSFYSDKTEIINSNIYHFFKKDVFGNGNIGVNCFFVLSGFLITYLLIEEKKISGEINLKYFWLRRILRIWPLFYACVFLGFTIFPFIKHFFGQVPNENASLILYLTFLNNFDMIAKGLPDSSVLSVLWSIAVEEQFYIVWPLVIFIFPLHRLWIAFFSIIAGSLVFRAYNDNALMHEYHTLSCIGDMAIGAFGAWLVIISVSFKKWIELLPRTVICLLYILFFSIFFFRDELLLSNAVIRIFERTFIAIVILLIILEQTYSVNSLFKMSNFRNVSRLGVITYGLYCLQFISILIVTNITKILSWNDSLWQVLMLDTILALMLLIGLSVFSYKYFERPFLRLKDKFSVFSKQ